MGTNVLAPLAVAIDGSKTAVPIDISEIDARLTFAGATHNVHGDATISFAVGPRQAVRSSSDRRECMARRESAQLGPDSHA